MKIQGASRGMHQIDLLDSVRALETAVGPTSSCGLSEIRNCLHAVEVRLCRSIEDSATNDQDPRLEQIKWQLDEEEIRLHGSLQELIAKTQSTCRAGVDDNLCDAVREWIQRYLRHRDRQADLTQDAWSLDLGTGD